MNSIDLYTEFLTPFTKDILLGLLMDMPVKSFGIALTSQESLRKTLLALERPTYHLQTTSVRDEIEIMNL